MKNTLSLFALIASLSSHARADLVLTMGGDVNFNRNRLAASPAGVSYGKSYTPFSNFTRGIAPLIDGDINFANIETVVTSQNDLQNEDKKFAFASHTSSIEHLVHLGFNLFSLANNHTYDYGYKGMERTYSEMAQLKRLYPSIHYHGIETRPNLLKPTIIEKNGIKIAFATISIADSKFRGTDGRRGLLYIHNDSDYRDLIKAFADTQADYKILSTHYGTERQVQLDKGQQSRYEYAIDYGDIDLIIGHHPHVIRPVQKYKDKLIFYSLGNYVMLGSADMTLSKSPYIDWSIFSRVHIKKTSSGKAVAEAVEIIPITNTHARTIPMQGEQAQYRIRVLNTLNRDQIKKDPLQFTVKGNQGVYCAAKVDGARAKQVCR